MVEVLLGFLMQRMSPVNRHIFRLLKLRIQGIIHAGKAAADFHLQKAGNLTYQRFQFGSDELYSFLFIRALFQGINHDMLDQTYTS